MSTPDTMTPLLTTPWNDAGGSALPVRSLPGLSPTIIRTLQSVYPRVIDSSLRELLAIDAAGRRFIAEIGTRDLPGPVWCVLPEPQVAVHISDDLPGVIRTLRERTQSGETLAWLQGVTAAAHAVWVHRRALAFRPYSVLHPDEQIRGWLASLPTNAYVYDLRRPSTVRGWPYGVAGPSARLYRCARLPVFAVAASPTEGWRVGHPQFPTRRPPRAAPSVPERERVRLCA
jgi:hypothetical protein